ncbi:MAG: transcriptional regulator, TraR/DksA family [Bryobacterales bacterium]|jgi:DnaK suppressor protein|nr:transcriptional regulator, TraR/DksA family [Bryobacterales bacterium]
MAKTKAVSTSSTVSERYSHALITKSQELRASMSAQNAAQVVARPDHPSDEGDLSQRSHDEWIFLNRNKLEVRLLRDVEDALRRIESEQYGVCQECGEPISRKRLEALPWAKYCVSCQDLVTARKQVGEFRPNEED